MLLLRGCGTWRIGWAHYIGNHHWLGGLSWLRHLFLYFTQGLRSPTDFQISLVTSVLAKARRVWHGTFCTVLQGNLEILVSRSGGSTVGTSIFIVLNEYVINHKSSLWSEGRLSWRGEHLLVVRWIAIWDLIFAYDYFLPILGGLIHDLWTTRRFIQLMFTKRWIRSLIQFFMINYCIIQWAFGINMFNFLVN